MRMRLILHYVFALLLCNVVLCFVPVWRVRTLGSSRSDTRQFAPTFLPKAPAISVRLETDLLHQVLPKSYRKARFNSFYTFLLAWSTYRAVNNGSTAISPHFVVPSERDWPQECWGLKLGTKVANTRARRIYSKPNQIEMLSRLGFEWNPSRVNAEQVLEALRIFTQREGHPLVRHDYVVPEVEEYPRRLWGLKLGAKLKNFRYRGDYAEHAEAFRALGVTAEKVGVDTRQWDAVYAGLLAYEALLGEVSKVSRAWEVPCEPPWPEQSWGVKLGYRVHNMRYRGDYILDNSTQCAQAAELGIYYKPPGKVS